MDVLETIQADSTSLDLPPSKRPLEYAKPTLEPHESWPRNSPRRDNNPGYDGYRQQSERPPHDTWQRNGYQPSFPNGVPNGDMYGQGYNGPASYRREQSPSRAQQMSYRNGDVSALPKWGLKLTIIM